MVGPQTNTTLIGRLRIRSKSSDPQAEQQRIARMLGSATLHPRGLPESATLVVRRLVDPLPSRLRVGPLDILPDVSWQQAVTGALEKLAAAAARPAYGAVPAESDAVLFYDRAEVLASLAMDWMSGTLAVQWWWRELFRGRDVINALLREWIDAPQYVPSALDLLAQRKLAVQFVQRLPRQAVAEMLEAVLTAYRVPRPDVAEIAQQETFNREEPAVWLPVADKKQTRARTALLQTPAAPWVPEASTQVLSLQKKVFLAQALMLRRAPAEARTVAFQKKLLQWQARAESTDLAESGTGHVAQAPAPAASQQKFSASAMVEQVDASETSNDFQPASSSNKGSQVVPQPIGDLNGATPENQDVQGKLGPEAKAAEKTAVLAKHAPIATAAYSPQQGVSNQEVVLMPEPASTLAAKPDLAQAQTAELSTTLETEFGGIFFLLSLTLYLYIYGDFTSPAEPGLELNIWDFLALMAHELTGGAVEKDTLWEQLASLAGRPKSVKPGLAFAPPDEWRVSQEWLAPFSHDYDPRPILINGRMISMHPAGFIVTDVPAETDSQFDLNEAIGLAGRLQRWVGWMASYFRARLVLALGREDAVALLCTRPARIVFTLTHIDVTFSLDHHPIELRMAGLDRDLGWIPAAGRYVAFHFK